MRVLHVIPSVSSKRGGPSRAVLDMVKTLRMEGIDAEILTTTDNVFHREADYPLGIWFEHEGVPVIMFSCSESFIRLFREFLFSPGLTLWLINNIRRYDLVHVHALFSYPSSISMIIARLMGVDYIIRTIGQLNVWSLRQNYWMKRIMIRLIERANINGSAGIHVTSENEYEDVKKLKFNAVIYNLGLGINIPESKIEGIYPRYAKKTTFLFLSRLHPKKQLEKLLEALCILKEEYKRDDWLLYVGGDGEEGYVEKLHCLGKDLGIDDNILWLGHITGKEKEQLFKCSDWFVLPSASENFGISAVEALAFAVPVIITRAVGIAELVETYKSGIITSETPRQFSLSLNSVMNGPSVDMKQSALRLVDEMFTWKVVVKRLILLYTKVTSSSN